MCMSLTTANLSPPPPPGSQGGTPRACQAERRAKDAGKERQALLEKVQEAPWPTDHPPTSPVGSSENSDLLSR